MTLVRPFVHTLSLDDGGRTLIPTTATLLRAQSFLDGRTDFSTGPAYRSEQSLVAETPDTPPDRYIFHVGFCGSTLLSRLLDQPGRSLVLREPNCLADLANQANQPTDRAVPLDDGLAGLRSSLRQGWQDDEALVVKPSNWVNRLLPNFAAQSMPIRALFLTMDRAAFVRAIVRGGPERLQFAARAALHFSNADDAFPPLLAETLAAQSDGRAKLVALAAAAHEMQVRLMRHAATRWQDSITLTLGELVADPIGTAKRAATTLDLALDEPQLTRACDHWVDRHAKAPELSYSRDAEAAAQAALPSEMSGMIDDVLEWAAATFGD